MEYNTHPEIDEVSDEELEYFGKNSQKMNEIERKMKGEGNGINSACLMFALFAAIFLILWLALHPVLSFFSNPYSAGYNIGYITVLSFQGLRLKVEDFAQIFKSMNLGLSFIAGIVSVVLGTKGLRRNLGRGKGLAGLWIGWIISIASVLIIIFKILLLYSNSIDF